MAARRLFFALWPDDPLRHALLHWQTANLPGDVRWQHRDDLHLTLHFLGAVEVPRVAALRELGDRLRAPGFELVLDDIGHWPRPQVLWAAPSRVPERLLTLHAVLGEALSALGFSPEARRYRPHVTLARKVPALPPVRPLPPLTWQVRELALVESLRGAAPHYRPTARWALA